MARISKDAAFALALPEEIEDRCNAGLLLANHVRKGDISTESLNFAFDRLDSLGLDEQLNALVKIGHPESATEAQLAGVEDPWCKVTLQRLQDIALGGDGFPVGSLTDAYVENLKQRLGTCRPSEAETGDYDSGEEG
jgi:hypothetical protein